jgi:DNA invertase Pin-like site-specific DNA recombinase
MKILYVRVSSVGQNNERQIKEGFDIIFTDVISGSIKLNQRPEGSKLIKLVNEGKVESISVHSIDRLGRNVSEMLLNIELFTSKGVCVISEKEGIKTLNNDGSINPIAKLIISVLGSIAEFELSRIKERTQEGIQRAKLKGVYVGRASGSTESREQFMNKKINQKILKTLKSGETLRRCALLCGVSVGLVIKVRDLNIDSIPKPKKSDIENLDKLKSYLIKNPV